MKRASRTDGGTMGRERGIALIWALLSTVLIGSVILSGTLTTRGMDQMASMDFATSGQAQAVAEAGLVDAFAWFRRQTVQPVVAFAPRRLPTANPPVNETDDPAVGLVREYEITPSLWARYEVRPGILGEEFVDANSNGRYDNGEPFTDANGNGKREPDRETRDVSTLRGLTLGKKIDEYKL